MDIGKKYQVFVSSTYVDLQDERKAILKQLLELDCIPAGMELFPSTDEDQWTFIQQVIDESDYYIVIIGAKYGSVAEDGLSYTEKEFDYAVSKGIPVLGFVHGKPESIPQVKCEMDPDRRKKLEAFISKIEKRLRKDWISTEDLCSKVVTSLSREMKTHPRPGYIRGDKASNPEKLLELNEKISELEKTIEKLRSSKPEGIDNLEQEDDVFEMRYKIELFSTDIEEKISLSWNKLLEILGPSPFDECSENQLKNIIQIYLKNEQPGSHGVINLYKEDFDTILTQFIALGLIQISEKKHTASDKNVYFSLTEYGKMKVIQLKARKRKL